MATNDFGLSIPTVIKWLLVIVSIPLLFRAYEGIFKQEVATGGRVPDRLLVADEAVRYGFWMLGGAVVCLLVAWAIWKFWEPNID